MVLVPHPLGRVRQSWERSPLRPWVLAIAVALAVLLMVLVFAPALVHWYAGAGDCSQTTTLVDDGSGTASTVVTACTAFSFPSEAYWVTLALFALFALPEIATLLPGLKVGKEGLETPDGDLTRTPSTAADNATAFLSSPPAAP
jgi:hypothetical protein